MAAEMTRTMRRWVLTGGIAAITATGTWYGAGLKMQQEFKEEVKARKEATPTERIEQLQVMRTDLIRKKIALERKVDQLASRRPKTEHQSNLKDASSAIK